MESRKVKDYRKEDKGLREKREGKRNKDGRQERREG